MSTYTLISSDSHIIEPTDLWETRLDRQFRGRGPRLVHEGDVDQWYADGVRIGNYLSPQSKRSLNLTSTKDIPGDSCIIALPKV
ncbi:MAG: hypothetical protein ACRERE_14885 [Candidatus Entotheonellia bacterium]